MSSLFGRAPTRPPITWTDFQRLRVTGKEPGHKRLDKLEVAELAARLGIRTPRIFQLFDTADDIQLDREPAAFVLKPSDSKSHRGVMLLHRLEEGVYWEALRKRPLTDAEIIEEQAMVGSEHQARFPHRPSLTFFTEELLRSEDGSDDIPFDYKLFTFHGQVKFILQVDRNHPKPRLAFFTGDFEVPHSRVAIVRGRVRPGRPRHPRHAADILDIARKVSLALQTPFVSVDCYSADGGAYLGEITKTPGGPYYGDMYRFTSRMERELGAAYGDAYRALGLVPAELPGTYPVNYRGKVARQVNRRGFSPLALSERIRATSTAAINLLETWRTGGNHAQHSRLDADAASKDVD